MYEVIIPEWKEDALYLRTTSRVKAMECVDKLAPRNVQVWYTFHWTLWRFTLTYTHQVR